MSGKITGSETEERSNCIGCFFLTSSQGKDFCPFCIREPSYASKKQPTKATIEGLEITVPQDFYVTRDAKTFLERMARLEREKEKLIEAINREKEEDEERRREGRPPPFMERKKYWEPLKYKTY